MKKTLSIVLALVLALTCFLAVASAEGTTTGTWSLTTVSPRIIDQGALMTGENCTITLLEDGTYILTSAMCTLYSSDGGETYNPVFYGAATVYGTYEVTEIDEELGDTIINLLSVDRCVSGEYDSDVDATDEVKAAMTAHATIGMEIILGSDHKVAEMISFTNYTDIASGESAY